jgi:hypothetical protein
MQCSKFILNALNKISSFIYTIHKNNFTVIMIEVSTFHLNVNKIASAFGSGTFKINDD